MQASYLTYPENIKETSGPSHSNKANQFKNDPAGLGIQFNQALKNSRMLSHNYVIQHQKAFGNRLTQAALQSIMQEKRPEEDDEQAKSTSPLQSKTGGIDNKKCISKKSNTTGLSDGLKGKMESAFQADFSGVKIHTNSSNAVKVNALAFTQGHNIHFAPGQFNPNTSAGKHLIGHELAHVVQQRQGRVKQTTEIGGMPVNDNPALEQEADAWADKTGQSKSISRSIQAKTDNSGCSQNKVAQRRMGVEAELTVPITRNEGSNNGEGRVRSFLGLGVGYNNVFQPTAHGYHIDTDKDPIARTVAQVRDRVNMALVQINKNTRDNRGRFGSIMSWILGPENWDEHQLIPRDQGPVANMEFVTNPFDEETTEGREGLENTINTMTGDMNRKLGHARAGIRRQGEYNYGVPSVADWRYFAQQTGVNVDNLLAWRQQILDQITNRLYVQITAGILPAGIAKLQREADRDSPLVGQVETLGIGRSEEDHVKARRLVTIQSAEIAENVINELKKSSGLDRLYQLRGQDRLLASLQGYLSLITSYILGHTVVKSRVGTVHKNIVPFFSKLPLNQVQQAMDTRVRPDQWSGEDRTTLKNELSTQITNELNRLFGIFPFRSRYYKDLPINLDEFRSQINDWLPGVLDGSEDEFSEDQLEACTQIDPERHAKSQRIYEPVAGRNNFIREGQEKVIALEYRMIREDLNLTPDNLWVFVRRVMNQIRRAND